MKFSKSLEKISEKKSASIFSKLGPKESEKENTAEKVGWLSRFFAVLDVKLIFPLNFEKNPRVSEEKNRNFFVLIWVGLCN